MSFRQSVLAIIIGLWLVGLLLMSGQGKVYKDETPNNPNPTSQQYINEDRIEPLEGINNP